MENQTSALKTRGQQLDAEFELRFQGSEIETCTSETKTSRRTTRADTKKQLKPMDTQEMFNKLKLMLNPWQNKGRHKETTETHGCSGDVQQIEVNAKPMASQGNR